MSDTPPETPPPEPPPVEPPTEPAPEPMVDAGTVCDVCGRIGRAEGHH